MVTMMVMIMVTMILQDDDDHCGDDDELKGERGEQPLQSRHRLQEED